MTVVVKKQCLSHCHCFFGVEEVLPRCLNHTRWLKNQHKKKVIWIYDLAHMLSAGASAVVKTAACLMKAGTLRSDVIETGL